MNTTTGHTRTIASIGAVLVIAPLVALGLAACSSAAGGTSSSTSTRSAADTAALAEQWDLARAKCMREAGFDVGDPAHGIGGTMSISRDMDLEGLTKASETCAAQVSQALGERPVTDSDRQRNALRDQYADKAGCLREHGVDIPDSTDDGAAAAVPMPGSVPQDALEACGVDAGSTGSGR